MCRHLDALRPIEEMQPTIPQSLPARFAIRVASGEAADPCHGMPELTNGHGFYLLVLLQSHDLDQNRFNGLEGRLIRVRSSQIPQLQEANCQDGQKA